MAEKKHEPEPPAPKRNRAGPKPPKKRRPGNKPLVDRATVEKALRNACGNMAGAAKQLKVSRVTVWKYVRRSPALSKLLDEIFEETVDLAEGNLLRVLKNETHRDHVRASIFVLRTLGRTRGYTERTEVTGPTKDGAPNGDPTPLKVQVYLPAKDPE